MTYHNFQKEMKEVDSKRLNKFTIKLMTSGLFLSCGFFVVVSSLANSVLALLMSVLCMVLFVTLFDVIAENKDAFDTYEGYVRFWWVSIPICVLMILIGVVL